LPDQCQTASYAPAIKSWSWELQDFLLAATTGADLGFYKGGCPIHLKVAPEVERRGVVWGGGYSNHTMSGINTLKHFMLHEKSWSGS